MNKKVGDKVYLYTSNNDEFRIHECTIYDHNGELWVKYEYYSCGRKRYIQKPLPDKYRFGMYYNQVMWLYDRDDEYAMKEFLEDNERILKEYENYAQMIEPKRRLVKFLREGLK